MEEIEECEVYGPLTTLQYLQWLTAHELEGHIGPHDPTYPSSQYLDLVTDDTISTFLDTSPLYDSDLCEWRDLPRMHDERDIRVCFKGIVASIIRTLGKSPSDDTVQREVCTTDYRGLLHVDSQHVDIQTSPAMVIRATGPSFENPLPRQVDDTIVLGYSNVASCFEIITEEEFSEDEKFYAEQSSVFAR